MSVTYRNFKTHKHSDGSKRRQQMADRKPVLVDFPLVETQQAKQSEDVESKKMNQRVIGHVFHTGPQTLTITVPGDVIPVKFGSHTVLSGLRHDDDSPDIITAEPGIYEISYCVSVQATNSAYAAFAVQADGLPIDGSMTAKMINTQECVCSVSVLTELDAGITIRLVMTSGTAVNVQTVSNGVSASMMVKKID